jgi:hypothetical protein
MKKALKFVLIVYLGNIVYYLVFTAPLLKQGIASGIITQEALLPFSTLFNPVINFGSAVGSGGIIVSLITAIVFSFWQEKKMDSISLKSFPLNRLFTRKATIKRFPILLSLCAVNLAFHAVLLSLSIDNGLRFYDYKFWPISGLYESTGYISGVFPDDQQNIKNETLTAAEAIYLEEAYELKKIAYPGSDTNPQATCSKLIAALFDSQNNLDAYNSFKNRHWPLSQQMENYHYNDFMPALDSAYNRGVSQSQVYEVSLESFIEDPEPYCIYYPVHIYAKEYWLFCNLRKSGLERKDVQRIFPSKIKQKEGFYILLGYNFTEFLVYGVLLSALVILFTILVKVE